MRQSKRECDTAVQRYQHSLDLLCFLSHFHLSQCIAPCQCYQQRVAFPDTHGSSDLLGNYHTAEVVSTCQERSKKINTLVKTLNFPRALTVFDNSRQRRSCAGCSCNNRGKNLFLFKISRFLPSERRCLRIPT